MHATPSATSEKIFNISGSVNRFCNRVFIKSISPPPAQYSINKKTSYPPPLSCEACESMYLTIAFCPLNLFIVSTSVLMLAKCSLSGTATRLSTAGSTPSTGLGSRTT